MIFLIAVLNCFTQQFFNQNFLKPGHDWSLNKIIVMWDQPSVDSLALCSTFSGRRSMVLLICVLLISNLVLFNRSIVHILVLLAIIIGHD